MATHAEAFMSQAPLVEVRDLRVSVRADGASREAVSGVSFSLDPGECLALVGESGSGKTLSAFRLLGLSPSPDVEQSGGEVCVEGRPLATMAPEELRRLRGRRIAMVFQEPSQALNPVRRIRAHLQEVLTAHELGPRAGWEMRMVRALDEVGLPEPAKVLDLYPFELSGGMMQRACIAMALIAGPDLVIADEPTTALDPTVSRRIVDLLARLRAERGIAILYISHDLHWVGRLADRVGVLYLGRLVEIGPTGALLEAPRHPYTQGLVRALSLDEGGRFRTIPGDTRDRPERVDACPFAPRCERAQARCLEAMPALEPARGQRQVACWNPLPLGGEP